MFDSSQKIGGEGKIVHIDRSKFGKRKYNRGPSRQMTMGIWWNRAGEHRRAGDLVVSRS